ncbi:MAG: M20/M25/M40 family metallo-hydrolase [Actinobacteria bacterium]|nr:M20/M25/M40 family metallo-hydrolase [Actinomycetota bacterium]
MKEIKDIKKVKEYICSNIDGEGALNFLQKVISIPSVTSKEREVTLAFYEKMKEIGLENVMLFEFEKGRPNLYGKLAGNGVGKKLMLIGHTDVVSSKGWHEYWRGTNKENPYSGAIIDDEIWGRGSADMKASLVAFLFAIKAIKDSGIRLRGDVINILVGDEESGEPNSGYSKGIKDVVEKIKNNEIERADFAIYGEPTSLNIYTTQMGFIITDVKIRGRSAYFGTPWLGLDALKAGHTLLGKFFNYSNRIWGKRKHRLLGRAFNLVTSVDSGGPIAVPEEFTMKMIRKILPEENLDEVAREIEEVVKSTKLQKGIRVEVKYTAPRDHGCGGKPAEINPDHEYVKLFERVIKKVKRRTSVIKGAPFWSEISFLINELGIPSVYFGPGDITNCHTFYERVKVSEIIDSMRILVEMIVEFCGI